MDIDIMLVPDFFLPKWTKSSDYIYLILQPYLIQTIGEEQLLAYIKGFNYPGAAEGSIERPNIKLRLFNLEEDLNERGEGFDLNDNREFIPVPLPDTIQLTLSLVSNSSTNNSNEPVFTLPARDYRSFSTLISHSRFVKANKIYPQKFAMRDEKNIPYRWWKPDDSEFPYQPQNYERQATFSQMLFHQMRELEDNQSFRPTSGNLGDKDREANKLEVQLRIAFMFGKLLRIYDQEGQPLFTNSQRSEIMHVPNLFPTENQDDIPIVSNENEDNIPNEVKQRWHTNIHSLCGLVYPIATKQQIEDLSDDLFSDNLQIKLDLTVPEDNQQVIFSPGDVNTISFPPDNISNNPITKIFSDLHENTKPEEPSIRVSYPDHLPDPAKLIFVLNKSRNLLFDAELTRTKSSDNTEDLPQQTYYFSYFPEQDRDSDPEKRGSHQKPPLHLLKWSDYASVSLLTSSSEDTQQNDIKFDFKLAISGRFRPYRQFQDANDPPSRYLLIFEPDQRLPTIVIKKLIDKLNTNPDVDDIELLAFGLETPDPTLENDVHAFSDFRFSQIKKKLVHFDRDEEENLNSYRPVFFFDELELAQFNALSTRAKFLFTVSEEPIQGEWQEEFNPESDEPDKRWNFLWRSQPKDPPTSPEEDIEFNVLSFNLPAETGGSRELAVVLWYEKEFDFHLACSARHLWLSIIAKYDAIKNSWLMNDSEGSLAEVVAVDGWNHKELNVYFKDVENPDQFKFLNPQSMLLPTSESDPLPGNNSNVYIERKYLFSTSQELEDENKPDPFPLPPDIDETEETQQYTLAYPTWPRDYTPFLPPRISQLTKSQNDLVVSLGFEHQYGTQLFGKDQNGKTWETPFTPYLDWIFTDPTTIKKPAQQLPFSTSTPIRFQRALEAKDVEHITEEFSTNGIILSEILQTDDIQTQKPNKEWTINNPGEELPYIIRKENGQINIYRDESFLLTFSIPQAGNGENSKLQLQVKGSWLKADAENDSIELNRLAIETRKAALEFKLSDSIFLLINGYIFDWRYDEDEVDGSGHDRNFSQKLKPIYFQKRIEISGQPLQDLLQLLGQDISQAEPNPRNGFVEIDLAEKIHENVSLLECQLELQRPQNLTYPIVSSFQLWSALDGGKVALIYYEARINSVNFSPNRSLIITASNDNTARVWDFQGQEILFLNHPTEVTSAQFNFSGLRILTTAVGDSEGEVNPAVYIWNLQGLQLYTLPHASEIKALQLSPNSTYLLTIASNDPNAHLWDLQEKEILLSHATTIISAQFSPNGERILTTASEDSEARLWNLQGEQLASFSHSTTIISAQFSPNGERILTTASEDPEAHLWNLQGEQLASFPHSTAIINAQFSPDGERILTTASKDSEARLWNLQGEQLASFPHSTAIINAQFSPDGERIITTITNGNGNNNVTKKWLWDTLTGTELAQIDHEAEIKIAGFSPDSQTIVTASNETTEINNLELLRPKLGNQDKFMFPDSDLLNSEWENSFEDVSKKPEVRQALLGHLRSLHLFRNYLTPSYSNIDVNSSSPSKRDLAYRRNLNLLTTRSYAMAPEGFLRDKETEIRHAIVPLAFLPLAHDPIFFESTQEIFRLLLEVLSSYEQLRLDEFNSDAYKEVDAWKEFFNNNGRLPIKNLRKAIARSLQPIPRNDLEDSPNNLAENLADQWRTADQDSSLDWPQQYIFNLLKDDLRIYAEAKALLVHALKDQEDSISLEKFPSYFYKLEVTKDVTEQDINEETLNPLSIDIDTFTYQQTTTYKPQNTKLSSLLIGDVLDDLTYDNEFSVDRVRCFSGEEFIESLSQEFIFELKATDVVDGEVDDEGFDVEQIINSLNEGILNGGVPDNIRDIFQAYGRELSANNSFLTLPLNFIFEINESRDKIDSDIEKLNEQQIPEDFVGGEKRFFNRYYIQLSSSLSLSVVTPGKEWEIADNEAVDEQGLKRTFIIYKVDSFGQLKLEIYERDRERFSSEWWIRDIENDKTFLITVAELKEGDDGNTEITSLGVDEITIAEERPKPVIRLHENVLYLPLLGKKSPGKDALVKLIARSAPSQALIVFQGIFGGKTMSSDRQLGDREYTCKLRAPSEFSRLKRENSDDIDEPSSMIGVREDGSEVVQSFLYPDYLNIWTEESAREHCENQGGAFDEEATSLSLCLPSLDKITAEKPFVKCDSADEVEFIRTPKVLSKRWPQMLELNVVIVSLLIAVNADEEGQLQRDRLLIRRRPPVEQQNNDGQTPKILPPFTITEDQDDIQELRENGARAVSIERLQKWLEPEQPEDPNVKKLNLVDWMSKLVQRNLTLKEPEGEKWSDGYITFTRNDEEEDSDDKQKPILNKIELPERTDVTINSMRVSLFRPVFKNDNENSPNESPSEKSKRSLHLVGVEVPVIAGEEFSTIGFRMVRNDEEDFDPRFIQFSRPAQRPAPIMATKIEDFKGSLPDNRFLLIPTDSTSGWSIETFFIELAKAILGPDETNPERIYKEPRKLYQSIIRVSVYHVDNNPSPRLGFTQRDGGLTLGKRLINETGYKRPFSEAKLVFRFNEPNVQAESRPIYLLKEHLLYWINIKCFTSNNVPFLELLNIPANPDITL